jgi:hypothetical protein
MGSSGTGNVLELFGVMEKIRYRRTLMMEEKRYI